MTLTQLLALGAMAGLLMGAVSAAEVDLGKLKENSPVEVREGDTWSSATYLKREGRRFQVRYSDGTEEWLAADRLRTSGAASSGAASSGATLAEDNASPAPSVATQAGAASAPRKSSFAAGDVVEFKDTFKWATARIDKTAGGWFLVQQTEFPSYFFWAEPWRLRCRGSAYEIDGQVKMIMPVSAAEPAPGGSPGQSIQNNGESRFIGNAIMASDELASAAAPMRRSAIALKLIAPPTLPAAKAFKTYPVPVDPSRKCNLIACSDDPAFAVLWTSWPGQPTEVQILDLAGHRSLSPSTALGQQSTSIVAATNQGRQLATAEMHAGRITLWTRQGNAYKFTGILMPFGEGLGSGITQAAFVSPTRMVAVSFNGAIAAIDLQGGKITGRAKCMAGGRAALHSSGKLLAFVADFTHLQIVQTETWTTQTTIRTRTIPTSISFDPTGRYLATEQTGNLVVYDTATGAEVNSAPLPVGMPAPMALLDEQTALYGGSHLVDIKTGLAMWAWTGPAPVTTALLPTGQAVLAAFSGNQASIHLIAPLTETVRALRTQVHGKALPKVIRDKLALVPGISVSLECNLNGLRGSAADAETAVRKNIQDAGFNIAADQPVRVNVSIRDAGSARAMIAAQGMASVNDGKAATADVTIHKRVLTVSVQSGDEILWTYEVKRDDTSAVVTAAGKGTVQLQADDGITVRDVSAVRLPRYLALPGGTDAPAAAVGQSRIIDDEIIVTRDPMTPDAPTTKPAKKIKPVEPKTPKTQPIPAQGKQA